MPQRMDDIDKQVEKVKEMERNIVELVKELNKYSTLMDKLKIQNDELARSIRQVKNITREWSFELTKISNYTLERIRRRLRNISESLSSFPQALENLTRVAQESSAGERGSDLRNDVRYLRRLVERLYESSTSQNLSQRRFLRQSNSLLQQQAEEIKGLRRATSDIIGNFARRTGLGGLSTTINRVVNAFRRFGGRGGILYLLYELGMRLYQFVQETYMQGRQLYTTMAAPAYQQMFGERWEMWARGGEMFGVLMNRIYYRYRITEQEQTQLFQLLRQSGQLVEFNLLPALQSLGGEYRNLLRVFAERPEQFFAAIEQVIPRMYILASQMGLTVRQMLEFTTRLGRMTGSRDFELLAGTLGRLRATAENLNIEENLFVNWVVSASEGLRWFGYGLRENARVASRFAEQLRIGAVTTQEYEQAIRGLMGRQNVGMVLWSLLREQTPVGGFVREVAEREGIVGALEAINILRTTAPQQILQLAQRTDRIGRAVQRLISYAGEVGMTPQELARQVRQRTLQLFTTELPAMITQSPIAQTFLMREFLARYAGINEQNLFRLMSRLDMVNYTLSRDPTGVYGQLDNTSRQFAQINKNWETYLSSFKNVEQHIKNIESHVRDISIKLLKPSKTPTIIPEISPSK